MVKIKGSNGSTVELVEHYRLWNNVTCSGYLFEAQNGYTVLVIPIANPGWYSGGFVYEYYSLHNLPSKIPTNGSWVTI